MRWLTYLLAKGELKEPAYPIGYVIEFADYTGNKLHPSQKPITILLPLIELFQRRAAWCLTCSPVPVPRSLRPRCLDAGIVGIELDTTHHPQA
jgi:site-specific DNA-methyltransferase (adenine-specific)